MLAIFILNMIANCSVITPRSSFKGSDKPNSCPYDNHHKKLTPDVSSPISPPITSPAKINIIQTQVPFPFIFQVDVSF